MVKFVNLPLAILPRLFATPAAGAGIGIYSPGFSLGISGFMSDYNYKGVPNPDLYFSGNDVSTAANIGPLNLSLSQSSDGLTPIRGYTSYGVGLNFISSYGVETNIGQTYLKGFALYNRK